jgi:ABC-type siderophore export system fused ATPase/permease subunit
MPKSVVFPASVRLYTLRPNDLDRLYGMEDVAPERVTVLLDEMQLRGKTDFASGRFRDVNFSTGQRKRLALTVALLEDRPILEKRKGTPA